MLPHHLTLMQTINALETKQLSAVELAEHFLSRIDKYNPALNAYVHISEQAALQARTIDEKRARGEHVGLLGGVFIAVKDLFDTETMPTAYGGRHFMSHIPRHTATPVVNLQRAGAIVIGKTNLHEYAYGTTTENPHYGNTRNPWNRAKISGGSSGGSGAAVTAGLCTAALGTDTGGSIRIPAALCGHVGLKPSFGLVSKRHVFPLAPTLDHIGPMTRNVADAALLLSVMAGYDASDPLSTRVPSRDYRDLSLPRPIRIGVPRNFFFDKCHASVMQVIQQALQNLQSHGVQFDEIEVPFAQEVPDAQTAIIASEAYSVHREMLERQPELYGEDVRRRLEGATDTRGYEVVAATEFRKRFRAQVERLFDSVDVIVTPTTPLTATDVGQSKAHIKAHEVNVRAHLTRYTNPWNLSGLPAVSIPCGTAADGLPVGMQLVGSMFSEPKLLAVAQKMEEIIQWNSLAPEYR